MKKIALVSFLIFVTLNMYAPNKKEEKESELHRQYNDIVKRERAFDDFLHALALSESSGSYKAYNRYGYLGRYQLGRSARKATGFEHITLKAFKNNPCVWSAQEQEIAIRRLILLNTAHLTTIINKYDGKTINGIKITKSGILGASHLAGASGTKRYFSTNGRYNPTDALGTSLEDYLIKFGGFYF